MKKNFLRTTIALMLIATLCFTSCATKTSSTTDTVIANKNVKPDAPTLPLTVTEDMDFFKDGYEIVKVDTLADGDTTTFTLKSGTYTTRYLAIDTPETSNGVDPWGMAAKRYTNEALKNAKQIILERDPALNGRDGEENSTKDKYDRLLAHVWVDGELLQYKLIEESLARVMYLYFPYKYNDTLIRLEDWERNTNYRRVHNSTDKDPEYDYSDKLNVTTIDKLGPAWEGKRVEVTGIVSGIVGQNAYMQTADGSAGIYIYTNHHKFKAFSEVGTEATFTGRYTTYNGIPEIGSPEKAPTIVSKGNPVVQTSATTQDINQDNMGRLLLLEDVTVKSVANGLVLVEDEFGSAQIHNSRSDTKFDVEDYIEVGKKYDILGNISVYNGVYQLILRTPEDIVEVKQ